MALVEVKVPDIGDFKDVEVIEVLVKPGDTVEGRAVAGHGRERQGVDGDPVARRRRGQGAEGQARRQGQRRARCCWCSRRDGARRAAPAAPRLRRAAAPRRAAGAGARAARSAAPAARRRPRPAAPVEVVVPDIGDFNDVAVIEVLVKPGDTVERRAER